MTRWGLWTSVLLAVVMAAVFVALANRPSDVEPVPDSVAREDGAASTPIPSAAPDPARPARLEGSASPPDPAAEAVTDEAAETRTLRIRVVAKNTQEPIERARLTLHVDDGLWTSSSRLVEPRRTDADGFVVFERVPKDRLVVLLEAEGFAARSVRFIRHDRDKDHVTVALDRARGLSGRIVDGARGTALAGARVELYDWYAPSWYTDQSGDLKRLRAAATTASDGTFAFDDVPRREVVLCVRTDSYATVWKVLWDVDPLRAKGVEVALTPAAVVVGQVKDAAGKPVPGARVGASEGSLSTLLIFPETVWLAVPLRASPRLGADGSDPVATATEDAFVLGVVVADATGAFRFEDLALGGVVRLFAETDDGRRSRVTPKIGLVPGEPVRVDLTVSTGGHVTFAIVRPDGKRVPEADVWLRPMPDVGWGGVGESGADGRLRLGPVPPGHYEVGCSAAHHARARSTLTVEDGDDREIRIELQPLDDKDQGEIVQLRGIVYAEDGSPLAGATAKPRWRDAPGAVQTDAGGRFTIPKKRGVYPELEVEAEGFLDARVSGWHLNDEPAEITLARSRLLRIPLLAPKGETLPDRFEYSLRWERASRSGSSLKPKDGALELEMKPGPARLVLECDGWLPVFFVDVELASGEVRTLEPVLLSRGVSLRVAVVDPDGSAVSGARVIASQTLPGEVGNTQRCRTDEGGRTVVTGIAPDVETRITVVRPGGGKFRTVITPRGSAASLDVRMDPVYEIRGHVAYENGLHAARAHVSVAQIDAPRTGSVEATTLTDNAGRFLVRLPAGAYRFVVRAPGRDKGEPPAFEVEVPLIGDEPLELSVPRGP